MTNLTINSEEIKKEIIEKSLEELFDFFIKNIIIDKEEKNINKDIIKFFNYQYVNNIDDNILKNYEYIKKYEFLFEAKNMVFRLHYDFYVLNDKILIKPCISEGKILIESDFSDKILIIYLYICGFWLISLHDNNNIDVKIIENYKDIFILFKKYLKNNCNEEKKKYLNLNILFDVSNDFTQINFFNPTYKSDEIFKNIIFEFIQYNLNNYYATELYTLSSLNDFV